MKAGDLLLSANIPLSAGGTNQIRVGAGGGNSVASVELGHEMPYGFSCQNGVFNPWPGQPKAMYFYVPPHAEELELEGGPVEITDEEGKLLLKTDTSAMSKPVTARVAATDKVWKIEFTNPKDWKFRIAGFPVILCPTPEAARLIHASVEVLPDGTTVCWKFQRKIAELLPKLLDPKNVGVAEQLIVPLASRENAWLADPVKNHYLLNSYSTFPGVEWALRSQNVDPKSIWGGSISGWQERINKPAPENRWDRFKDLDGLWAGASTRCGGAEEDLAQAALLDSPLNPYYGKKELLYRAAAAALRDLMTLGEDEVWRGTDSALGPLPRRDVVSGGTKNSAGLRPHRAAHARRGPQGVDRGVRHIVDRGYPDALVGCMNQSSHFVKAYEEFALGSGDPAYARLARAYAKRFVDGQAPSGYFMENQGPDASYVGMTLWHLAAYYREAKDPVVLEAIRKCYRFFNHTVAPEPGGQTILGGFNFNHRVGNDFSHHQWGGAKGILDDLLPEVGLWSGLDPDRNPEIDSRTLKSALASPALKEPLRVDWDLNSNAPRYFDYSPQPDRSGTWPAEEARSFTRDFDGQLIAIKRPAYYCCVYVGHPAPSAYYVLAHEEEMRHPLPGDADNTGGTVNIRAITPFLGGGLSMFWTPGYGSSIIGTDWTPLAHQGLVATSGDGTRNWEEYFASTHTLSPSFSTLTVAGKIDSLPLRYKRVYELKDDALGVTLTLTADEATQLKRLAEILPVPTGSRKTAGAVISVDGEHDGTATADHFTIHDNHGQGIEVVLDSPHELFVQRNGPKTADLQMARVEIAFPAKMSAGQTVQLHYVLKPLPPGSAVTMR